MLLLVWPIKQHLKHSTAFLIHNLKVHIPSNKSIVRPITTILQVLVPTYVLVRVSIAVKKHDDHGDSYKEDIKLRVSLTVQRFSPLSSWWEMALGRQTMCWRGSSEFYILLRRQEVISDSGHDLSVYETSKPTSIVTHFLQQDHTYTIKATPSINATPSGGHFLSNHHTHIIASYHFK